MDGLSVSVVPLQSQPHCVTDHLNRGHETNAEHSTDPASRVLHEGAHQDNPTGAYDSEPRTVWSDHDRCTAHTPTKRDGYVHLVWDFNGPLFGAPTTHPYRSTASLLYNPRDRPTTSSRPSSTLDGRPRAAFTIAQRTDTGGGNDRSYGDSWAPRFQPQKDSNDNAETESYLPSSPIGFSASSSPALVRFADGPDSSSGDPVATDLSTASNPATQLAEADPDSDDGRVTEQHVGEDVPPNISVEHIVRQSVFSGVKRVGDTLAALHRVQRSTTGASQLGKPAKLKSILKKNVSLASAISDVGTDDTTNAVINDYLGDHPLADDSMTLSPAREFSDIDTLMSSDNLEIDIAPSLLIPTQPKYFKVAPLPPYFIDLKPKKEQKYSTQNVCTLGPGHKRTMETTVKVTQRVLQRTATPGLKKNTNNPFTKIKKEPTVLPATYKKHPHFKIAVIDPIYSFPCLTNQQVYPLAQAAEILADNEIITELDTLNECETYRWDVVFTSSLNQLDRVSITTDDAGQRYINLMTGDYIIRYQIVTPHDSAKHAPHSPFTWNTHIYFSTSDHPTYVQSYQLN